MLMLKALLFDMDGTLADTDPIHMLAWQETFRSHDVFIDDATYHERIVGRMNPLIVKDFLPHLTEVEVNKVVDEKEESFKKLATKLEPLPGLERLLEWRVTQGLQTALVTNATNLTVPFNLQALGLDDYFKVRALADDPDVPAGKPDPRHYGVGLKRLGIEASEAVAFEDSPSGVRSASGAGIITVGLTTTQSPESLIAAGATIAVADFTAPELWEFLRQYETVSVSQTRVS
jgi:HAD superfamily hydrolase (TIGR01509 family)